MDINMWIFITDLVKTSMLCSTRGFHMLIHLTLTQPFWVKPIIIFILKIRKLRQLDSKSQGQIPTPMSLDGELLAE